MAYPSIVMCAVIVIITAMMIFHRPDLQTLVHEPERYPPTTDPDRHRDIQHRRERLAGRCHSGHRRDRGRYAPVDRDTRWQKKVDAFKLRPPIFGCPFSTGRTCPFCTTFSSLLSAGVPVIEALDIVAANAGNQIVADALIGAQEGVREGKTLSTVLAKYPVMRSW